MHIAIISVNTTLRVRDVRDKPLAHRVYSVDNVDWSEHDIY